ncbi:MAG TPA: type II toxin-antitoxin system ParD family antitoxin [Longimicrobiaceae bacterium]|nr:type II toxin-antitoxin system ParD family antitoxin [Longimicrobiaceae bacterium]
MNVSLTPEPERYINDRVESGSYRSASEVVRESVRLLRRVEEDREARLAALRRDIDEGLAELDRGEGIDGEEAFASILRALERDEEL